MDTVDKWSRSLSELIVAGESALLNVDKEALTVALAVTPGVSNFGNIVVNSKVPEKIRRKLNS